MSRSEHACSLEMKTAYVAELKKNVQTWMVSCACGWSKDAKSRDMAREVYRCHREGLPEPEEKKKEVVLGRSHFEDVVAILREKGPLRSEEVRGALHVRGTSVSEPTARKALKKLVEDGLISCKEMPSKRSKVVVLYFMPDTTFDAIASKVRDFDRLPSGFSVGRSF